MTLADALLNAKKYIKEPQFHTKENMWGFDVCKKGRWDTYFFLTEKMCWMEFYNQFRQIKELLLADQEQKIKGL